MSDLDQIVVGFQVWHCRLPVRSKRSHGIGTVADQCEVVVLRLTLEDGTGPSGGRDIVRYVTASGERSGWSRSQAVSDRVRLPPAESPPTKSRSAAPIPSGPFCSSQR